MDSEKLQEIRADFNSDYYKAVSDCCYDHFAEKGLEEKLTREEYIKIIEYAHEWFMAHFFEENKLD